MNVDIMRKHYRKLNEEEQKQMQQVKEAGCLFYMILSSIGDSREISLAKTKTEEAVMWATKHITR